MVLDFQGRATKASTKNMTLGSADDPDTAVMLLGKREDEFAMDYKAPLSRARCKPFASRSRISIFMRMTGDYLTD